MSCANRQEDRNYITIQHDSVFVDRAIEPPQHRQANRTPPSEQYALVVVVIIAFMFLLCAVLWKAFVRVWYWMVRGPPLAFDVH